MRGTSLATTESERQIRRDHEKYLSLSASQHFAQTFPDGCNAMACLGINELFSVSDLFVLKLILLFKLSTLEKYASSLPLG